MIKKLLLTLLVAAIVILIYRVKSQRSGAKRTNKQHNELPEGKLSVQLVAYIIVGFIVLFSSVFFVLNWMDNQSLITVRVINGQDSVTEYQIKKNALKGRTFNTTDGRIVELGDNDRLEILPQ